jgi:hypothetical protein
MHKPQATHHAVPICLVPSAYGTEIGTRIWVSESAFARKKGGREEEEEEALREEEEEEEEEGRRSRQAEPASFCLLFGGCHSWLT